MIYDCYTTLILKVDNTNDDDLHVLHYTSHPLYKMHFLTEK